MIDFNIEQVKFCAEECERQRVGPMAVYRMLRALSVAIDQGIMTYQFIGDLGLLVDPVKNQRGFRIAHVSFHGNLPGRSSKPEHISRQIEMLVGSTLLDSDEPFSPEEFYEVFEKIHPFLDGNGRVGALLYNWMRGSLDYPISPPNVFGSS